MQEGYIRRLVARSKCSVCGAPYRADNVTVLGHEDEFWFVSIFCDSCQNERLIAALVQPGRLTKGARETAEPETGPAVGCPAIGHGDVLEMRRFLQGFDGDFRRLFGGEPRG